MRKKGLERKIEKRKDEKEIMRMRKTGESKEKGSENTFTSRLHPVIVSCV